MDIVLFAFQAYDGRAGRDHHFTRLLSKSHRVFFIDGPLSLLRRRTLHWSFEAVSERVIRAIPPGGSPRPKYSLMHRLNESRWLAGLKQGLRKHAWGSEGPRIVLVMTPVWPRAYEALKPDLGVYDAHDLWELMTVPSARLFATLESIHADRADLVVATSTLIAERFEGRAKRVEIVPDGCEFDRFAKVRTLTPNAEVAGLPEPRFVYVGGMDECFDTEAVAAAARRIPEASFALIGPELESQSALSDLPNVHRLGAKPYTELPTYLAGASACILPYRTSERGLARDPIKLYEYLAAGKPVVSSPIPRALEFRSCVTVSDGSPEGFASACTEALSDDNDEARQELARAHTWQRRVSDFEALLAEALP